MSQELRNKLLSQALLVLSQVAFPLITYPVVTRYLGPDGLGQVNFLDSLVQAFLVLASLGIPLYGVREISILRKEPEQQSRLFLELFCLQAVCSLVAVLFLWISGTLSGVGTDFLWTGAVALVASLLSVEWYLQGLEAFRFIAIRSLIVRTIATILIFLILRKVSDDDVAWHPEQALFYYRILTGSVILMMLANMLFILRKLRLPVNTLRPFRHLRRVNWFFACYVLASFYALTDTLMLGWITGNDSPSVGFYSFAYRLVRMSAMLLPTLGVAFVPGISFHHAQENQAEVRSQIELSQRIIYFFGIPLCLFFYMLAPELIAVFAGPRFEASVPVLRILSLVPLLVGFSHLTGTQVLLSVKKEKIYFYYLLGGFALNLFADLLLIPLWKQEGAALSNLATEAFIAIGTFFYLRRQNLIRTHKSPALRILLASLPIIPLTITLRLLDLPPLSILLISGTLTAIVLLLTNAKLLPRLVDRRQTADHSQIEG